MKMEERERKAREIAEKYEFEYGDVFELLECVSPTRAICLLKRKRATERRKEEKRRRLERKEEEKRLIEEKWWAEEPENAIVKDDSISNSCSVMAILAISMIFICGVFGFAFPSLIYMMVILFLFLICMSFFSLMTDSREIPNWRYEQMLKKRWLIIFLCREADISDPKARERANELLLERFSPRKVKRIWKKKERILLKNEKVERRKAAKKAKEEKCQAKLVIAEERRIELVKKYYGSQEDIANYVSRVEWLMAKRFRDVFLVVVFGIMMALALTVGISGWLLPVGLVAEFGLIISCFYLLNRLQENIKVFEVFVKRQYKRDVIKRVIHPELYEVHIEELKPL